MNDQEIITGDEEILIPEAIEAEAVEAEDSEEILDGITEDAEEEATPAEEAAV